MLCAIVSCIKTVISISVVQILSRLPMPILHFEQATQISRKHKLITHFVWLIYTKLFSPLFFYLIMTSIPVSCTAFYQHDNQCYVRRE